jgi:hypothetical protein
MRTFLLLFALTGSAAAQTADTGPVDTGPVDTGLDTGTSDTGTPTDTDLGGTGLTTASLLRGETGGLGCRTAGGSPEGLAGLLLLIGVLRRWRAP